MGHVDLWTQLLHETESQGTAIQWLHVPSHIGVDGNTHADRLADIGRRCSPLLKAQVTVSLAGGESLDDSESEPESDIERGRLKRSARAVRAQCNYLGVWP